MPIRPPYKGKERKLVLSFDIGTTFSGISYSLLVPGQVPEIKGVTRFPAQEHVGGDSKIPSLIFYDRNGVARAIGAEAVQDSILHKVEDEGWSRAEWFKLQIRCPSNSTAHKLPPLPRNKSVIDVFSDFMRYLYNCAKDYICDTHPNGASLWASVQQRIEFVLSHPNGWQGAEQAQMRTAAIRARLIPHTNEGHARIHFVTEGEASLLYCIQRDLAMEAVKDGQGVLIVDAGGGTIDLSAYAASNSGYSFQEIAATQCHFEGSIFVTRYAREFLRAHLTASRFLRDLEQIAHSFDRTTKLRFKSTEEIQYIKFGSVRDTDLDVGIRSGQLKLPGLIVAKLFEPSISCIIRAIEDQRGRASREIKAVFLVGGFAASNWLFSQLKNYLTPLGLDFCRPDNHINKAVADGAVSFFLDHFVTARVSKYAYGIVQDIPFDETDIEHLVRSSSRFCDPSGQVCLRNSFSVILPKDVQVHEVQEFRRSYWEDHPTPNDFGDELKNTIIRYEGPSAEPRWTDLDHGSFVPLCTVLVPVAQLAHLLQPRTDWGKHFYRLAYDVILSFGLTELTAQFAWIEDGNERRCPAKIVYDYVM